MDDANDLYWRRYYCNLSVKLVIPSHLTDIACSGYVIDGTSKADHVACHNYLEVAVDRRSDS